MNSRGKWLKMFFFLLSYQLDIKKEISIWRINISTKLRRKYFAADLTRIMKILKSKIRDRDLSKREDQNARALRPLKSYYFLFLRMCGKRESCLRFHNTTHADSEPAARQHVAVRPDNAQTDRRWHESRRERISAHGGRRFRQRR